MSNKFNFLIIKQLNLLGVLTIQKIKDNFQVFLGIIVAVKVPLQII